MIKCTKVGYWKHVNLKYQVLFISAGCCKKPYIFLCKIYKSEIGVSIYKETKCETTGTILCTLPGSNLEAWVSISLSTQAVAWNYDVIALASEWFSKSGGICACDYWQRFEGSLQCMKPCMIIVSTGIDRSMNSIPSLICL